MDKFRWFDWFINYLTADVSAALIMAILVGVQAAVIMLPLLVLAWLSYEKFRGTDFDKEPD
jgi:hypothetical protein